MKNQKQTIRKIVSFLNDVEEDGGFWLPNIQRPFVWREDQIFRLFDSILREYPISTLLVWKTTSRIRRRKFIDNWKDTLRLSDFYVPEDTKKKNLVLDGQQRLQSLFIGLRGSFEGRELCLDILSGEIAAPDDVKYRFRFLDPAATVFPWIKFKDLVFTNRKKREILTELRVNAKQTLTDADNDKLDEHLDLVDRTFKMDEAITYQELDSIDNPTLYSEDDVVEVFIRANSGGTRLGKSDLLFSLLTASWEDADEQMEDLLESLNRHGFSFDRDFVLKTCLVLLGQGARYEVQKFRKPGIRNRIEVEWDRSKRQSRMSWITCVERPSSGATRPYRPTLSSFRSCMCASIFLKRGGAPGIWTATCCAARLRAHSVACRIIYWTDWSRRSLSSRPLISMRCLA